MEVGHEGWPYGVTETHDVFSFDGPDGHRHLHGGAAKDGEMGFPLPFFIVFVGYSFILLIDKVAFDTHSLSHNDAHERRPLRTTTFKDEVEGTGEPKTNKEFQNEVKTYLS